MVEMDRIFGLHSINRKVTSIFYFEVFHNGGLDIILQGELGIDKCIISSGVHEGDTHSVCVYSVNYPRFVKRWILVCVW